METDPAELHKKNSLTSSNIACVQCINKLAPRSAVSWVAWRAEASLATPWSCLRVETINRWAAVGQLHPSRQVSINVGSLLGVSWRAKQRVMLANKPCRTVRPPTYTLRCTGWGAWTARHRSHAWNKQHESCQAQNAASVEGLVNVCASWHCHSRDEARPLLALLCCRYWTSRVRAFSSVQICFSSIAQLFWGAITGA